MELTPKKRYHQHPTGHPRSIPNRECFRVNLRDALRCRNCGRGPYRRDTYHSGFEYHHVRPVRDGGLGVAENLALLCKACHRLADEGRIRLDEFDLTEPPQVPCRACGADFDPGTVEMNCGWYRCRQCGEQTHLFDHFGYGN